MKIAPICLICVAVRDILRDFQKSKALNINRLLGQYTIRSNYFWLWKTNKMYASYLPFLKLCNTDLSKYIERFPIIKYIEHFLCQYENVDDKYHSYWYVQYLKKHCTIPFQVVSKQCFVFGFFKIIFMDFHSFVYEIFSQTICSIYNQINVPQHVFSCHHCILEEKI